MRGLNINNFFLVTSVFLASACASNISESEQANEVIHKVSSTEHETPISYYFEWFNGLHQAFNQSSKHVGSGHRRFTIIVDPFFSTTMFISIEDRPEHETRFSLGVLRRPQHKKLVIGFLDSDSYALGDFGERGNRNRTIREIYTVDLTDSEFEKIFSELKGQGLKTLPTADKANGCTDGTQSFIKLQTRSYSHFITRHDCDESYARDLQLVAPIIDFSILKVPEVEDRITSIWLTQFNQQKI